MLSSTLGVYSSGSSRLCQRCLWQLSVARPSNAKSVCAINCTAVHLIIYRYLVILIQVTQGELYVETKTLFFSLGCKYVYFWGLTHFWSRT